MNRVIIVGAGASCPAGIPLGRNFLQKAVAQAVFERWPELDSLNQLLRLEGADDLYYLPEPPAADVLIRTAIVSSRPFIDLDIEKILNRATAYAESGKLPGEHLEGIKRLIFRTISWCGGSPRRNGAHAYAQLINRAVRPVLDEGGSVTILSFNYDLLVEKFLRPCDCVRCFSYRIPNPTTEYFPSYEREYNGRLDLLKLHGSLNWFRCSRCDRFLIQWYSKYKTNTEGGRCDSCGEQRTRVLIGPGNGKEAFLVPLRPIWDVARKRLRSAGDVFIIGYSFRPNDEAACALISQSLGGRAELALTVIDKLPQGVLQRLSDLRIDGKALRAAAQFKGFEEYANSDEGGSA